MNAWRVRDVDVGVTDRSAVSRGLRDCVYFGMNRPEAILLDVAAWVARFIDKASDIDTMRQSRRRSVVAGRKNTPIAHDHRAYLRAQAGGTFTHSVRERHDVFIPAGTRGPSCVAQRPRSTRSQ